jgi:phage gpG-like protein
MFKVLIKWEAFEGEMKRLRILDPRLVLQAFGAWMIGSVAENFKAQGRPDKWQKLKDKTLVARWMRGNKKKKGVGRKQWGRAFREFFGGAKILMDKGRLANSIGFAVRGTEVHIGTNLIYAATHQFGDKRRGIPERAYLVFQDDDCERFGEMVEEWLAGEK